MYAGVEKKLKAISRQILTINVDRVIVFIMFIGSVKQTWRNRFKALILDRTGRTMLLVQISQVVVFMVKKWETRKHLGGCVVLLGSTRMSGCVWAYN